MARGDSPALVVLGSSPVALVEQARPLGYHVTLASPMADLTADADLFVHGFRVEAQHGAKRFVVVSTQGKGDEAARFEVRWN